MSHQDLLNLLGNVNAACLAGSVSSSLNVSHPCSRRGDLDVVLPDIRSTLADSHLSVRSYRMTITNETWSNVDKQQ